MSFKERVYLSGRITGLPDLGMKQFEDAANHLRQLGYAVFNPHELNGPELDWKKCMVNDIRILTGCDAIALLDNWKESRGAKLELLIAVMLGLAIYDAQTMLRLEISELEITLEMIRAFVLERKAPVPENIRAAVFAMTTGMFTFNEIRSLIMDGVPVGDTSPEGA